MTLKCEIQNRPAQHTLSVRVRTSVGELSAMMGEVYGAIAQYLGQAGRCPAGAPYGAYYNMDMEDLDVEIGFPVDAEMSAQGDIKPGLIPAGKVATCTWTGPYDQSAPAYEELTAFIAEQGAEATGVAYEYYLNDPGEVPPEELQTEIVFPLK
jgi:effector-binding domain-containing protein